MHLGWLAGAESFCVPIVVIPARRFGIGKVSSIESALALEESWVAMFGPNELLAAFEVGARLGLINIKLATVDHDESACLEVGFHFRCPLASLNHEAIMGLLELAGNRIFRLIRMPRMKLESKVVGAGI